MTRTIRLATLACMTGLMTASMAASPCFADGPRDPHAPRTVVSAGDVARPAQVSQGFQAPVVPPAASLPKLPEATLQGKIFGPSQAQQSGQSSDDEQVDHMLGTITQMVLM